jgi:hypothetical protein
MSPSRRTSKFSQRFPPMGISRRWHLFFAALAATAAELAQADQNDDD